VAERVRMGGHAVPERTVRQRYAAGLRNFFELYQSLAAVWRVYDNSEPPGPRLMAEGSRNEKIRVLDRPTWQRMRRAGQ